MSNNELRTYHFETAEQWSSCLFAQADRRADAGILPFAPFARDPIRYETNGGRLPVVTRAGEIIWLDDDQVLHRLSPCADTPETGASPRPIACALKIAATSDGLWAIGQNSPGELELYEAGSFTRLLTIDVPGVRLVDLSSDGRRSVFALAKDNDAWKALSFDSSGRITREIGFEGLSEPLAFTFLRNSQRFVVLTNGPQPKIQWFTVKNKPAEAGKNSRKTQAQYGIAAVLSTRVVAALRPCFTTSVLGSNSKERVFLAGRDGDKFGRGEYILTFDSDGNSLGDIPVEPTDGPITGLSESRGSLLATGKRGLLRFDPSEIVPDGAASIRFSLITPMLFSPDREDNRRWLRVEATAHLPEGTTLEISYASADKDEERNRLLANTRESAVPASHRVERLLGDDSLWKGRTVFRGGSSMDQEAKTFSAKLFDEQDRYLWVSAALTAAPGARLPALSKLDVLYPGRTLMENLPATFQKDEARPDSFLRSLVGVLETTTHGIDERIASLGSLIAPASAPGPWLDFVARWIGLPWDDELSLAQKRSLLGRAEQIITSRGTRNGLETLLDSLFPGEPRRFRVTDPTADLGFAMVGGSGCSGSTLPAILGGHTQWNTELDWTSVLGRMRLKCAAQTDDGLSGLAGKVRIDVAATAAERKAWEPWLLTLITEMVPLTARAELRWVTEQSLRTGRLDGTIVLEPSPTAHLGTDAITNLARLPDRPVSLSDDRSIIGRRLQ
jgi:phage tail-like protein